MKPLIRSLLAGLSGFIVSLSIAGRACGEAAVLQSVPLPYTLHDERGNQWDVQPDGSIGPGGADVFDAGGRLYLDQNTQYASNAQQATFDPRRGEIILPTVPLGGLSITRRITVNAKGGWCRWVELIENHDVRPRHASLRVNFDLGGSNQGQHPINDVKHNNQAIGAAFFDGNRGISFLFAGRGNEVVPTLTAQPGTDQVDEAYEFEVPGRQTVAIVHIAAIRATSMSRRPSWNRRERIRSSRIYPMRSAVG